ncbi:hypothetical protein Trydic_g1063 [Trypoxylus dichotomus]
MEEEGLAAALASWATNAEIQALFLVGCTCVGAWVLFKWIMQIVFSTLWPFFVVVLILMLMPHWRKTMVKDVVPKHLETIRYIGQKFTNSTCNR